jgi:energy-converting hydrogenase Eha subunit C
VRANLIGLIGTIILLISVGTFWLWVFIGESATYASNQNQLATDLKRYLEGISILFLVGVCISAFSPLGTLLQLPGTVYMPLYVWHMYPNLSWIDLLGYFLGLAGTTMLLLCFFVEMEFPGMRLRSPPTSRWLIWHLKERAKQPQRISKTAWMAIASMILAVIVILGGAMVYAFTNPSSKMIVYGFVDKGLYGTLDIVFYLDGKQMAARHLEYDPLQDNRVEIVSMTWNVTAGEHKIAYDFANETGHRLDGVMEYTTEVRTLPYTSEEILIGVGVGFA